MVLEISQGAYISGLQLIFREVYSQNLQTPVPGDGYCFLGFLSTADIPSLAHAMTKYGYDVEGMTVLPVKDSHALYALSNNLIISVAQRFREGIYWQFSLTDVLSQQQIQSIVWVLARSMVDENPIGVAVPEIQQRNYTMSFQIAPMTGKVTFRASEIDGLIQIQWQLPVIDLEDIVAKLPPG